MQLILLLQKEDPTASAWISASLVDISVCMKEYHLQLNLASIKLVVFLSATSVIKHNVTVHLGWLQTMLSTSARNQMNFTNNNEKVTWSDRSYVNMRQRAESWQRNLFANMCVDKQSFLHSTCHQVVTAILVADKGWLCWGLSDQLTTDSAAAQSINIW